MNETLLMIVIGLLGVISHSLLKASSLQTDAKKANIPFKFRDYLESDYLGICLSLVSVFAWLFLFPEASVKYPALLNWMRGSFFAMGMVGSYLIQLLLSRAKKTIRKEVDEKTNELDEIKKEANDPS